MWGATVLTGKYIELWIANPYFTRSDYEKPDVTC
jgi:hypothetical protein